MIVADTLKEAGYLALESCHADHAIDALMAKQAVGVHVLFRKVDMPGTMSGVVLTRYVRGRWPRINVILNPRSKSYNLSHVLAHVRS